MFPSHPKKVLRSTDAFGVNKGRKRLWTYREGWELLNQLENTKFRLSEPDKRGTKRRRTCSGTTQFDSSQPRSVSFGSSSSAGTGKRAAAVTAQVSGSEGYGNDENVNTSDSSSSGSFRIIRRLPQRFGIFCTNKTSMHGPNPSALRARRPTGVRLSE